MHLLKEIETRKERHRQLAHFFNGHWAGEEKPYSDDLKTKVQKTFSGETSGNRRVRGQPFALRNGVVLEQGAELNVRRGVEAVHHMLRGGLLEEAAKELCSLDGVCSQLLFGEAFNLIQHYSERLSQDQNRVAVVPPPGDGAISRHLEHISPAASHLDRIPSTASHLENIRSVRVKHFFQWVRRDAHIPSRRISALC